MGFGTQVKLVRKSRNLTIQELSKMSKVSTSMLSQIEREEKNPTINVACQIAEALDTTLSALLEQQEKSNVVVIREDERLVYRDGKSGFQRHLLSPSFPARGIEFILNIVPPQNESGLFPPHKKGVKEFIYIAQGSLRVELGNGTFIDELHKGDSLYFEADTEHRFINLEDTECHYFLVIDSSTVI